MSLVPASVRGWTLESNMDSVVSGKTKNVQLTCRDDHNATSVNMTTDDIQLIKIVRTFGKSETIAELTPISGTTVSHLGKSVVVSKNIITQHLALTVTWPVATKDTAGKYKCILLGFDLSSSFVSVDVPKTVKIHENSVNIEDLDKLIAEATSEWEAKHLQLEQQIAKLQNVIHVQWQAVKTLSQKQDDKLSKEIKQIAMSIPSNCTTKQELSNAIADAKADTVAKIAADNKLKDVIELENITQSIDESSKHCDAKVAKLTSDMTSFTKRVDDKFDEQNNINQINFNKYDSDLNNIRQSMDNNVIQYNTMIHSLKTDLTKAIKNRPCNSCKGKPTSTLPFKKNGVIEQKFEEKFFFS